jgi:hypothetical protein
MSYVTTERINNRNYHPLKNADMNRESQQGPEAGTGVRQQASGVRETKRDMAAFFGGSNQGMKDFGVKIPRGSAAERLLRVSPCRSSVENDALLSNEADRLRRVSLDSAGSTVPGSSLEATDDCFEHWSHAAGDVVRANSMTLEEDAMVASGEYLSFDEATGGNLLPYKKITLPLNKYMNEDGSNTGVTRKVGFELQPEKDSCLPVDFPRSSFQSSDGADLANYLGEACSMKLDPIQKSMHHGNASRLETLRKPVQEIECGSLEKWGSDFLKEASSTENDGRQEGKRGSLELLLGNEFHDKQFQGRHSLGSRGDIFGSSPSSLLPNGRRRSGKLNNSAFDVSKNVKPTVRFTDDARLSPRGLSSSPLKSFEKTGFTVVSERSPLKRRFRTGPSVAASASQVIDCSSGQSPQNDLVKSLGVASLGPMYIDPDLHDTFGAHSWFDSLADEHSSSRKSKLPKQVVAARAKSAPLGPFSELGMQNAHSAPLDAIHDHAFGHSNVPSYSYLKQLRQQKQDDPFDPGHEGGYIAEAKKVLSQAMESNSKSSNTGAINLSQSGAIGPLLIHLKTVAGDDGQCRAALSTLALLESNLPNRAITSDLEGQKILVEVLCKCKGLDVKETVVQLLWDLDSCSGKDTACIIGVKEFKELVGVLENTLSSEIASYALHIMQYVISQPPEERPLLLPGVADSLSFRITNEACAHKHHLQDADQYSLGEVLGSLLSDSSIDINTINECVERILHSLLACSDASQCQILLTVLSSLAVRRKPRKLMIRMSAGERILEFANSTSDLRLHARSLSLLKVLSVEGNVSDSGAHSIRPASWYFNEEDFLDS